jgi:hypothetical protein
MKLAISTALLVLVAGALAYPQEPDKNRERKDKPQAAQQNLPDKSESNKGRAQSQERDQEQQSSRQRDRQRDQQQVPAGQQRDTQRQQQQDRKQQQEQRDLQDRARMEQAERARNAEKQHEQETKQQQQADRNRERQDRNAQERAQRQEQRDSQRAGRDGGNRNIRRIREEDFHTHFGRAHHFHVERRDDRRFYYGGYWFTSREPWPADWGDDDDVYIDEAGDEYYLIDPVHPGLRIVVYVAE